MKSLWFTPMTGGVIGIVKTESGRIYIGQGKGQNEADDEKLIAQYGAPFHLGSLLETFEDFRR